MQASAIQSSVKRQVLKTILFALPKAMNLTASRVPAFRERLKQRDLVAWIGLMDGSIGRIVEIKGGKFRSRAGAASEAQVVMAFKDVATALKSLMPNRKQGDIIHNAKNFKMVDDRAGRTGGLVHAYPQHERDRRPADGHAHARRQPPLHHLHQRRPAVRLRQGRPHPAGHPDRVRRHAIRRAGRSKRAAARFSPPRRGLVAPHALTAEIPRLFRQAHPLPHEAGRFRSRRRAQSAEPGQVRLRAHQLGRGPRHRRQGDQPAEARPRPGLDHLSHVVAPPMGQRRLLPQRAHALRQSDRLHPGRRQPGQLGGLVLGRHAPFRQFDARRRAGRLWRGRGLPEGSRDDRLLVLRSRKHQRRLCRDSRARRGACGPRNSASSSFISTRTAIRPPSCSADAGFPSVRRPTPRSPQAIMYVWVKEGLYDKDYVATRTTGFDEWKAYLLGETDGVAKTPEWQEAETGVPAKDVRALARKWGGRKVYLAVGMTGAGFGGAGRGATGAAMGALHGHDDGDAGLGQAGRQFRLSRDRRPDRPAFLLSRLCGRRDFRRPRVDRQRAEQLSAHAACPDDESGQADGAAPATARRHHQRPRHRLPVGRHVAGGAVRALHLSHARAIRRST